MAKTPVKLKLTINGQQAGDQQGTQKHQGCLTESPNILPNILPNAGTSKQTNQAVSKEAATHAATTPPPQDSNMAAPSDCEALLAEITQLKREHKQNATLKESIESRPKFTSKQKKQPAQLRRHSGVKEKEPFPEFDPRVTTTFDNTAYGQEDFNDTTSSTRNNSIDALSGAFGNVMGETGSHGLDFNMNQERLLSVDTERQRNPFSGVQLAPEHHFHPMPNFFPIQDTSTQRVFQPGMSGDMNAELYQPSNTNVNYSPYQDPQFHPRAYQILHTQDHTFSSPPLENRYHFAHPVYGITHHADPHSSTPYSEYVPRQHILPSSPTAAAPYSQYYVNGHYRRRAPAQQRQPATPTPELARKRTFSQSDQPGPRNSKICKALTWPTPSRTSVPKRTSKPKSNARTHNPAPRRKTTLNDASNHQPLISPVSDLPEPIWPFTQARRDSCQSQSQYSHNSSFSASAAQRRRQSSTTLPNQHQYHHTFSTPCADSPSPPLSHFLTAALSQPTTTTLSPGSFTHTYTHEQLLLPHTEIEKGLKQLDVARYISNAALSPPLPPPPTPQSHDIQSNSMTNLLCAQFSLSLLQTPDVNAQTRTHPTPSSSPLFRPLDGSYVPEAEGQVEAEVEAEEKAEAQVNEPDTDTEPDTQEAKVLVQRMVKAMMVGIDGLIRAAEAEQGGGERGLSGVKKIMDDAFGEMGGVLGFSGVGGGGDADGNRSVSEGGIEEESEVIEIGGFEMRWDEM